MSDRHTVTRNVSWGSRLKGAFSGILFGLLLFVVAFPLLFWNEGNAVNTARALEEGAGVVVTVPADRVDPAHEGKLVHFSATVTSDARLTDPDTGVGAVGIQLVRSVEMYQWEESSSTETTKNLGGSETQTTTYSYDTRWLSHPVDSSSFHDADGHRNPGRFPLTGDAWTSPSVTAGAYSLTEAQAASIGGGAGLSLTDEDLARARERFSDRLRRDGNHLTTGDPASPVVGDLRIRYELVDPQTISLIARQSGDGVAPYVTRNDRELFMLERGGRTAEEMFADAQRANTILTWILRAVGTFLIWLGVTMILRPISVIADVVPFLGNVAEKGIGLVAGMVTLPLSFMTAAFAWVFYRPVVGVGLLAVGAALFYLFKKAGDKKTGAPPPLPQG